ncbi:hypothetical protein [Mucilaginibacter ginsenosidivorans]|uniref:Uncharacterized protein n=1 Tax=Mucilaginibacter ginsenosidivorans TaxID=398053 RepID=A0A5B8UYJ5_9SPHI|nr:hypothetical protein [Mucilaginibacter ginsenosidivorans]QEC64062.1 hypothetical protein FRZ54_16255 [Mucilaginibacter ginsenosidivorans]
MMAIYILYLYLATGLVSTLWLLFIRHTYWNSGIATGVKFIILPGCVVLWPVVLFKSLRS